MDAGELDELGNRLCDSGKPFLWVVRPSEAEKLPQEIRDRCKERGLIVPWCPQLEVLAHKAIGPRTYTEYFFLIPPNLDTWILRWG
jgi:hypothetical protein